MLSQLASPWGLRTVLQSRKALESTCRAHFKAFDDNGDGLLDEQEQAHLCKALGEAVGKEVPEVSQFLALLQQQRTGSAGLTLDEFVPVYKGLLTDVQRRQREGEHPMSAHTSGASSTAGRAAELGVLSEVTPAVATSEEDGVTVIVNTVAGNSVGSYGKFLPGDRLTDLHTRVAMTVRKGAATFQLLHGLTVLDTNSTFAEAGVIDGAELTICFASPSALTKMANEALDACPERELEDNFDPESITIGSSGFRMPQPGKAYDDWCSEQAPAVSQLLDALAGIVEEVQEGKEDIIQLALRCLRLTPPPYGRPLQDMLFVGPVAEIYPDKLTLAAAQLLSKCAKEDDNDVKKVLHLWLSRVRLGGMEPSYRTIEQVLRMLPKYETTWSQRRQVVSFIDRSMCELLNVDFQGRELPNTTWHAFYGHLADADIWWMVQTCYEAIIQLMQGVRKDLKAPRFLFAWAVLNMDIDEMLDTASGYGVKFQDERELLLNC